VCVRGRGFLFLYLSMFFCGSGEESSGPWADLSAHVLVGGEEEEAKAEGRDERTGACDRQCGQARRRSSRVKGALRY